MSDHYRRSSESKLLELEEELAKIKWDIVGLSKVRQKGESWKTLKSGRALYHVGEQDKGLGVSGFVINKRHR